MTSLPEHWREMEELIDHDHGVLAIVHDVVALAGLHPDEIARAHDFTEIRRASFIGGRSALALALAHLGLTDRPSIGTDARGAPVLPAGYVGSVSHKGARAVALAAHDDGFDLGVDIELVRAPRKGVAEMILTPTELARSPDPMQVLAAFSLKESIYKAIAPTLKRYVAFREAEVMLPSLTTSFAHAEVTLTLANGEPAPNVEATVALHGEYVITTARALRRAVDS
jgi:enterobactin synthetase component D